MSIIETDRLILRNFIIEDLDDFHSLCSNKLAMIYMPETFCIDKNRSEDRLTRMIQNGNDSDNRNAGFAVVLNSSSKFIGVIGLSIEEGDKSQDGNHRRSLGFFYLPEYWGNGFATESGLGIVRYGFMNLDAHKITAGCISENITSERVLIKIGMRKEAYFREHVLHENEWKDQVRYGLLKSEWLEKYSQ